MKKLHTISTSRHELNRLLADLEISGYYAYHVYGAPSIEPLLPFHLQERRAPVWFVPPGQSSFARSFPILPRPPYLKGPPPLCALTPLSQLAIFPHNNFGLLIVSCLLVAVTAL